MISSILAFVVVLGILIFVHELGHFVMAKRFGVGVEKFSLGFGPKVVGRIYGKTEYLLSAVPLGGYVKMVGEDPKEPLPPEEQERSFTNQKLWKRFFIVFAGPAFNILFAVAVFWGMFMGGYPSEDNTIGWVERNSPAWAAGLRPGDRVLSVNEESVRLWDQISDLVEESGTDAVSLGVRREEQEFKATVKPRLSQGKNVFGEHENRWDIGIRHYTLAPVVGISAPSSPAGRAGFRIGDLVLSVEGEEVKSLPALEAAVLDHLGREIRFEVRREDENVSVTLALTEAELGSLRKNGGPVMDDIGLVSSELFVRKVESGSPAETGGVQTGDRVIEVEGKPVFSFADLQEIISEKAGIPVALKVVRAGETRVLTVTPEERTDRDMMGNKITVGKIGIYSSYAPLAGPTLSVAYNPFTALFKALSMTWEFTVLILVSLVKLVQQVIPAETLGGPILIAQLAGQQIHQGMLELFKFMALISINLGILNLLPIPILDGGHILFFGIEGILGRPLSLKKREMAQQVGLLLLLSLILFVTYNDIMRIFS